MFTIILEVDIGFSDVKRYFGVKTGFQVKNQLLVSKKYNKILDSE